MHFMVLIEYYSNHFGCFRFVSPLGTLGEYTQASSLENLVGYLILKLSLTLESGKTFCGGLILILRHDEITNTRPLGQTIESDH